jgi:hypothetical protein
MSGGTVTSDESLGEPQRRATRFPRGASTRIADPAACPRGERAGAPVPRFHSWSATDQPRGVGPRGESDDREMDWLPWPPVWTWDITPSSRSRRQPANCVRRRKDSWRLEEAATCGKGPTRDRRCIQRVTRVESFGSVFVEVASKPIAHSFADFRLRSITTHTDDDGARLDSTAPDRQDDLRIRLLSFCGNCADDFQSTILLPCDVSSDSLNVCQCDRHAQPPSGSATRRPFARYSAVRRGPDGTDVQ